MVLKNWRVYVGYLKFTLNSTAAIYCVNKKFYKFSYDVTTGNRAHISPTNDDGGGVAEPHLATFIVHVSHAPAQCKGQPPNPTISHHNTINARYFLQKRLVQDRKYSDAKLDVLSALILAESSLHGPTTKERMLVLRVSLALAKQHVSFLSDNNI